MVSVIVTVYKRTVYLAEALQSVKSQTFTDYEILLKDDSGTGIARDIAARVSDHLPVRYLPNAETLGIARSLRAGIEAASGKYIAILNDDDAWEPDFLETLVAPLEHDPRRILAFSDHWVVDQAGTINVLQTDANSRRYKRHDLPEGEIADLPGLVVIHNGIPLAMAAVFRKDAIDPAQLVGEVGGAYDYWISCLLASTSRPVYYVPRRLTRYRVHREMETARLSPHRNAAIVHILEQVIERNLFPNQRLFLQSKLGRSTFHLGRDQLYFHNTSAARVLFRRAFAISPGWKAFGGYLLCFLPSSARIFLGVSRHDNTSPETSSRPA